MSGNADSKQMSTPIVSGLPFGVVVTVSVCAPAPGIMLLDAALLMLVSQPSWLRNGMYSPNGTSRVLTYRPWMPDGLTSTATFPWPLALNSAVSDSEALTRWVGFCTLPGWTRAIVTDRTAGNGAVRANASGPEPAATANAAMPRAPRAMRWPDA